MAIALHQRHFRFGLDNGTEATHTWVANEDTAVTLTVDTPFLLRFALWEEGGTAVPNLNSQFQCRRNGGAWQNVTTTSTICKAVAVAAFTNGQHCTRRLTQKPTGTFVTNNQGCTEDGNSGGNQNDVAANGYTETEAGLQLVGSGLATGDTIEFQLTVSYTGGSSVTRDVTPAVTANKPSVSPSLSSSVSSSLSASLSESVSSSLSESASPSGAAGTTIQIALLAFETPDPIQYSRPSSDVSKGTWTASTGTDLWEMLNETSPDDDDYIRSGGPHPTEDTCKLGMTPMVLPGAGTVYLRVRGKWKEAT